MKHPYNLCLCCGQKNEGRKTPLTAEEITIQITLLEQLGYTREKLLSEHAEQLDYQLPGLRQWLQGQ